MNAQKNHSKRTLREAAGKLNAVRLFACGLWALISLLFFSVDVIAQKRGGSFRVLAFYTAKQDPAHISFVEEADRWFSAMGVKHGFQYGSTSDWTRLHTDTLRNVQLLVFFDTRPDGVMERKAFERYMKAGGAWMGFHFAAFALSPSAYPADWDWYHNEFLGGGQYKGNTWRPTAAVLKVEARGQWDPLESTCRHASLSIL